MKYRNLVWIAVLALSGCVGVHRSVVADKFGYASDSRVVPIGPYQVHYGSDGQSELLLVARGNRNLYSVMGIDCWTVVYNNQGLPFIDYNADGSGVVSKVTVNFQDADGQDVISYEDTNADGTWDHRLDLRAKAVYDWQDGQWVNRKQK